MLIAWNLYRHSATSYKLGCKLIDHWLYSHWYLYSSLVFVVVYQLLNSSPSLFQWPSLSSQSCVTKCSQRLKCSFYDDQCQPLLSAEKRSNKLTYVNCKCHHYCVTELWQYDKRKFDFNYINYFLYIFFLFEQCSATSMNKESNNVSSVCDTLSWLINRGVSQLYYRHMTGNKCCSEVSGMWFAKIRLNSAVINTCWLLNVHLKRSLKDSVSGSKLTKK